MGDENKQFEASQQKLRKAREQGQVVKSKDLSIKSPTRIISYIRKKSY